MTQILQCRKQNEGAEYLPRIYVQIYEIANFRMRDDEREAIIPLVLRFLAISKYNLYMIVIRCFVLWRIALEYPIAIVEYTRDHAQMAHIQ